MRFANPPVPEAVLNEDYLLNEMAEGNGYVWNDIKNIRVKGDILVSYMSNCTWDFSPVFSENILEFIEPGKIISYAYAIIGVWILDSHYSNWVGSPAAEHICTVSHGHVKARHFLREMEL